MENRDSGVIKTLLLGHSFITHFKSFIRSRIPELNFNLNLDPKEVMIQYSGRPGATIESLKECQLTDVEDFEPHLVILDIGTNDLALTSFNPEKTASAIVELVYTLQTVYNVRHIVVLQILHRFHSVRPNWRRINIEQFNNDVDTCNQLLAVKLSRFRACQLWWHKGLWGENQRSMIDAGGVHLSKPKGQRKYFYNLRAIVVSYLKSSRR